MSLRTKSIKASIVAQHKHGDTLMLEYQPGNGTRYLLHITSFTTLNIAPDPVREYFGKGYYTVGLFTDGGQGTCMTVQTHQGYLAPSYVKEKLQLTSDSDAYVLAEVIAHFTGRTATDASKPWW